MKLLEMHLDGKIAKEVDNTSQKIGNVDLWRIEEIVWAIAEGRNVRLTLTVEAVEESVSVTEM